MAVAVATGSVNNIAVTGCKIERTKVATPMPFIQFGTIERRMLNFNDYSGKIIEEYEQTMSAFDEQCYDIVRKAHMRVVGTRRKANGTLIYKRMSVMKAEKLERRQQRRLEAEKAFQSGDPYIITEINNTWHSNIKACEPKKRGVIFCTRSQKVRKIYKNVVHLKHTTTLDLAMNICSSFIKEGKPIEIIGKGKRRAVKCRSIHADNRRVLKVDTAHERCEKRSIDLKMDPSISLILEFLAIHTWKGCIISDQQVKKGMSGFVIPLASFTADIPEANNSIFIVRGRDGDDLVDAREVVPRYEIDSIEHYSAAEQFWKGFDETFRSFRTTTKMHERTNNVLDVVQCGEVAGIICQSLMPCCRITCIQCANEYATKSAEEVRIHIENTLNKGISGIQQKYPNFPHTIALLETYKTMINSVNTNREACGKVHFLIGDRTEQPFSHVLRVNEVLIKGNRATNSELNMASNELLEVARYLRNRTDNIKKGSLATFRNKVSAKAHINPSLMCDNQLDANGNFVWGKRGYHAKRFFANYFDVIQPADGYDKYIMRKFPNGSRKLAIQNLILPRNLDTLMKQLEGESIELQPLTQSCISKRHERNIYPCCCVTLEDGTPEYSEFKAPTKNHIVLGNSGDSKYLDMPADISENLYIAKEGYCYINIFLAMLVNVDEKDAKDYTKWVRDVVTEQLKEWPTMIQVALACYQLSVLFPSVKSAELPRILVDHKTQTMHVIDSYGSATTGYHILKANTVSQLEKFASDTLESEMKHYRVGGLIEDNVGHHAAVKLLIQSVYKPKVLKTLLMEEPYLIVLSIISPSVLIALYKSGSLYRAIQMLHNKEPTLRMVVSLLTMLATKVSRADDMYSQYRLIQDHAERFREVLNSGDKYSISRRLAEQFIEVQIAVAESNHDTESLGFRTTKLKGLALIEKIYQQDLEELWQGLPLLEKCSCILWQLRHRRKLQVELGENGTQDLSKALITFKRYAQDNFDKILSPIQKRSHYVTDVPMRVLRGMRCKVVGTFSYLFSDLLRFVQVLAILSVLLAIFNNIYAFTCQYREFKMMEASREEEKKLESLDKLYAHLSYKLGEKPTFEEFRQFVSACNPQLVEFLEVNYAPIVEHQAVKRESEVRLEQIVAFVALVMMIFDNDRSDCVYRVLNKFKNIVGVADQEVIHQSLDDIKTNFDESNETIDFELVTGETAPTPYKSTVFSDWWSNQLNMGRTIPHYRTEGHFMEFTRDTVATVVSNIIQSEKRDFLIRGAVGSGKSTGLPAQLAKKGKVLIVEPTRPLSENVFTQLRSQPFHLSPTLLMRNSSHFGSTPISIMTSGYALHYLANSGTALNTFDFIIMDECHVLDANAMALYSLLHDREYTGKILKVSATPPGREVEFKTQFPVKLKIEESLSFQQFVEAQGTGTNSDVTDEADNILVYVSSYNEVDQLSKMLGLKGYKVTKVDGRTMKNGSTSIKTSGTPAKKHFIVATNIIENGVTLDIEAVVDFGMKVSPSLDVDGRRIMYSKVCINYGERIQRLGRVGRVKPGVALRIGSTQKGIEAIPNIIATEAAFSCFVYGLPVMTSQVSTSLLSRCTVQQAKTAMLFELPSYFMINFIDANGSMHPHIHEVLKKFKLRESEIQLNKMAIPYAVVNQWLTVTEYNRSGNALQIAPECRIPFLVKEIPDTLYEKIWQVVMDNKGDAGFRRLTTHNAARVAYKLRTDEHSLQKTIGILNQLIIAEREKQAHFESLASFSLGSQCYSLQSICNAYKSRYAKNHTTENISVLEAARAQLIEFSNVYGDSIYVGDMTELQIRDEVVEFGALETVVHQSKDEIATALKLKSRWNKSLITRDLLVCFGVAAGGAWMVYQYLMNKCNEVVEHQGKNKKGAQRLKFRNARDAKVGRVVFDDDSGAVEHLFGAAYTKKGKKTGKAVGLGKKTRRFVNMYGFDPTEYAFVRFVDPITGEMIDENPVTDIKLIEEHFDDIRYQHIQDEKVPIQALYGNPGLTAYFVKDKTSPVLKVDLTHHVPLKLCDNSSTIAGFPEMENMLRQTGAAKPIDFSELPVLVEGVDHEAKSLNKGLRDYNSVAKCICLLENDSDGSSISIHGIGFGPLIITNRHLFKKNNGTLTVKSLHGEFKVVNSASIRVFPVENCDILILRMPKDFPPFPSKLKFRAPKASDVVCLVGSNFQEKYTSSMVSSSSNISHVANSSFWRHWIDTQSGHCGLPLVSLGDGNLIGIHSLMSVHSEHNMFTGFPETFSECIAKTDNIVWARGWKYNPSEISWGNLKLKTSAPAGLFKTSKLIEDLHREMVEEQSHERWVYSALHGNLKAVATSESQLVTKHVVKGECQLFQLYLNNHPEAAAFFRPLMGFYQKSKLNKVAYLKDFLKYATIIEVGVVDPETFELAVSDTVQDLKKVGFPECDYVTDENAIFQALNMKSAVGALYKGKKRDYFSTFTPKQMEQIVQDSCERLYSGKLGVWNGSIKAELRPKEKVLQNKTRTFTAAPLDTLLAGKVCVDDFNNFFYSFNLEGPWSVGMSKFTRGWNTLLERLPNGWLYCDADGSRFDSSLTPYLINAVLQIRLTFMESWDIGEQMLKNLYAEIIYTPILAADGTIVKKFKGNNSGQPSTVVDNTLMVIITMHYALRRAGISYENFSEHCAFVANGDDLIIAVAPGSEHILDTLQGSFHELGLNYDFSSRTHNKEELCFMSHYGVLREDCLIPKLEQERIVSILEWDRATEPQHRLEAICAAMVEAWGYDELLYNIRLFYAWVLEQAPYNDLARQGMAPYISENALRRLYLGEEGDISLYLQSLVQNQWKDEQEEVVHQNDEQTVDAGKNGQSNQKQRNEQAGNTSSRNVKDKDKDVNVGTSGTFSIPRLRGLSTKLNLPRIKGKEVVNLQHLLEYTPDQVSLSNTRALNSQFSSWYTGVKSDYDLDDAQMEIVLNGLMVWCIENGTSPNLNGMWVMMDGDEQVEYPIKPLLEHAKPTFRQIMAHFSNLAEAYIEKRNAEKPYMPRYGLQRNLTDMTLARYAFDFYEINSRTPVRAREAHIQMKAAAVANSKNNLFGLDGNVSTKEENTERHTATDVNRNMHHLLGVNGV